MKRALKRIVQRAFEGLWATAFGVLASGQRGSADVWRSTGDQRVLVVAPHPDDEVAGCGGAILAHRRAGDRVRICCVTDGRGSRALGLAPEAMAGVRRTEIETAVARLDAELDWLGLREGDWQGEDLVVQLSDLLREFRPHVLYAPSRVDFHPEHESVALSLAGALGLVAGEPAATERLAPEIRIYPVQVPLTPILANLVVPIGPLEEPLRAAFAAYASQLGSLERCLRHRRYIGRLYGFAAAEELWRLSSEQYERLHREPPDRPLVEIFRGLRYYAWSDPLAYLVGRGERHRLAALVSPGPAA